MLSWSITILLITCQADFESCEFQTSLNLSLDRVIRHTVFIIL